MISATAGFGKTTLVVEWLNDINLPSTWYSLDHSDNDPIQFITYFVHTLQRIYPDLGTGLLYNLQSPQPPNLEEASIQIINEIAAIDSQGLLVLDDLHIIDYEGLWKALTLFVDNQPERLHLVITSRDDPPLPLTRLRACGEMLEIRAQDLQFNQEETAEYLTHLMGIDLTNEQIEALKDRTEGWVAGLQLAAISIQEERDRTAFIDAFSGSHRFVLDYLTEEVCRHLPEEIRLFLLKAAVLERLSSPLCDALTDRRDSDQILRQIEEMNLFLYHLDHERRWYRYHYLFAEVLCKELNQYYPDEVPRLHSRASAWYESAGLIPEAIHHAHLADDQGRLADLVESHTLEAIKRGQIHLSRRWIESVSAEIRVKRPRLNMNYGWVLFLICCN